MPNQHTDFWRMVDKSGDCWLWRGHRSKKGYGTTTYQGIGMNAHRVAWLRSGRFVADGLTLDHLCRNRKCINPEHLEPVPQRENVLRGDTLPAANLRKTTCRNGHPYSTENTIHRTDHSRVCRRCNRERNRRYKARRIAALREPR